MTDLDPKPGETWLRRDGGKARIYATDGRGPHPIHGSAENPDGWAISIWGRDGSIWGRDGNAGGARQHPHDLIRRYDWRDELAPIWAVLKPEYRWMAMDEDGEWWAYRKEAPDMNHDTWGGDGERLDPALLSLPTPDCDWSETCVERPEGM